MKTTKEFDDQFAALLLGDSPRLRQLAKNFQQREADADDLLQKTRLRAWQSRWQFDLGTSIAAWTTTIMRNLAINESMANQRHHMVPVDTSEMDKSYPGVLEDVSCERSPVRANVLDLVNERIVMEVQAIPDPYREAFLLFALEGLTYEEIGYQLRVPVGTIISRI